jgi:hypothetical protein
MADIELLAGLGVDKNDVDNVQKQIEKQLTDKEITLNVTAKAKIDKAAIEAQMKQVQSQTKNEIVLFKSDSEAISDIVQNIKDIQNMGIDILPEDAGRNINAYKQDLQEIKVLAEDLSRDNVIALIDKQAAEAAYFKKFLDSGGVRPKLGEDPYKEAYISWQQYEQEIYQGVRNVNGELTSLSSNPITLSQDFEQTNNQLRETHQLIEGIHLENISNEALDVDQHIKDIAGDAKQATQSMSEFAGNVDIPLSPLEELKDVIIADLDEQIQQANSDVAFLKENMQQLAAVSISQHTQDIIATDKQIQTLTDDIKEALSILYSTGDVEIMTHIGSWEGNIDKAAIALKGIASRIADVTQQEHRLTDAYNKGLLTAEAYNEALSNLPALKDTKDVFSKFEGVYKLTQQLELLKDKRQELESSHIAELLNQENSEYVEQYKLLSSILGILEYLNDQKTLFESGNATNLDYTEIINQFGMLESMVQAFPELKNILVYDPDVEFQPKYTGIKEGAEQLKHRTEQIINEQQIQAKALADSAAEAAEQKEIDNLIKFENETQKAQKAIQDLTAAQERLVQASPEANFGKLKGKFGEIGNEAIIAKQSLEDFTEQMKQALTEAYANGPEAEINIDTTSIQSAIKYANELADKLQHIKNQQNIQTIGQNIMKIYSGINQLGNSMLSIFQTIDNIVMGIVRKVQSVFKSIYVTAAKVTNTLKAWGTHIAKAVIHAANLGKETKRNNNALSKGIRFLIRYGLGLRSMYFLARRIRTFVTSAFDNMYKYGKDFEPLKPFHQSIYDLKVALETLRYTLFAAFEPLITTIVPYITKAIEWIASKIAALGQIIAAFFGRTTYLKTIKKGMQGIVDVEDESLDKSKKKNKEQNKQLSGLDKINNITSKNEKDETDAEKKAKALNPANLFEEVPIEDRFKDIADKIKEFLNHLMAPIKAAWDKMKGFVMGGFLHMISGLKKLFGVLADAFWRVWDEKKTQEIFEMLFHILGNIMHFIGYIAEGWAEALAYADNAYRIFAAIRDVIWTIVKHIDAMVQAWVDWARVVDWKPLFTNMADWLQSVDKVADVIWGIIEDINLEATHLATYIVESLIPRIFAKMEAFNQLPFWDSLRENLKPVWSSLEKFLEDVGDGLLVIFQTVLDIAGAFGDWLANADFGPLADALDRLGSSIEPTLQAVHDILMSLWDNAVKPLFDYLIQKGGIVDTIVQELGEFSAWLQQDATKAKFAMFFKDTLYPILKNIADILPAVIERITAIIKAIVNGESTGNWALDHVVALVKDLLTWLKNADGKEITSLIEKFVTLHLVIIPILTVVMQLIGLIAKLSAAFSALGKIGSGFKGIMDAVGSTKLGSQIGTVLNTSIADSAALTVPQTFGVLAAAIVAFFAGAEIGKQVGKFIFPSDKELYDSYSGIKGTFKMLADSLIANFTSVQLAFSNMIRNMENSASESRINDLLGGNFDKQTKEEDMKGLENIRKLWGDKGFATNRAGDVGHSSTGIYEGIMEQIGTLKEGELDVLKKDIINLREEGAITGDELRSMVQVINELKDVNLDQSKLSESTKQLMNDGKLLSDITNEQIAAEKKLADEKVKAAAISQVNYGGANGSTAGMPAEARANIDNYTEGVNQATESTNEFARESTEAWTEAGNAAIAAKANLDDLFKATGTSAEDFTANLDQLGNLINVEGAGDVVIEKFADELAQSSANIQDKMAATGNNIGKGIFEGINAQVAEQGPTSAQEVFDGYKEQLSTAFGGVDEPSTNMIVVGNNIMQGIINGFVEKETEWWTALTDWYTQTTTYFNDNLSLLNESILLKFTELKDGLIEMWTQGWEEGLKPILNIIIEGMETFINGIITAFNEMLTSLSSMDVPVPDWATESVGASNISFGEIPTLTNITIPRLAKGAVIPPSASQFMAMLGDNKKETEVVSPLSTMEQAFRNALADTELGGGTINSSINIDGQQIFNVVQNYNARYKKRMGGVSAFA